MNKIAGRTPVVLFLLFLASCTVSQNLALQPAEPGAVPHAPGAPVAAMLAESSEQSLRDALPPLPRARMLSGLEETSRNGEDTFNRSSSAAPQSPALELVSAPGELSWGIWELPAVDELRYLNVQLSTAGALPGHSGAYIAIANYATGRWEFQGPVFESRVLGIDPQLQGSPGGALYAAVLVSGGESAVVQQLNLIVFHANAAPSAVLEADLSSGNTPLSVNFDASGTSDPDDNISRYLWDWDGNGGIDEQSSSPLVSHVFTGGGSFNVSVTAEDSDGERDSAAVSIDVNSSPKAVLEIPASVVDRFETLSLQSGGSSDADGSIVLYEWDTDGIAGFESSSGSQSSIGFSANKAGRLTLRLRVTDEAGASGEASAELYVRGYNTEVVDDQAFAGIHTEIIAVNGRPAICYEAGDNASLWYTRATDAEGSAWSTPLELDPAVNSGQHNSMLIVNGRPAISYFDQTNSALKYIRANDSNGGSWGAPQTLESGMPGENTGAYGSMAIVNGRPAIAYANFFGENHFIRAADADGSSWNAYVEPISKLLQEDADDCELHETKKVL